MTDLDPSLANLRRYYNSHSTKPYAFRRQRGAYTTSPCDRRDALELSDPYAHLGSAANKSTRRTEQPSVAAR